MLVREILCVGLLLAFAAAAGDATGLHLAQGALAGEVTATTVVLQTRLTATPGLQNGDVPGGNGVGRFEISDNPEFKDPRHSAWLTAMAESDFILRAKIDGLKPQTRYFFRVNYGREPQNTASGPTCSFQTLPSAQQRVPLRLIVASCMSYAQFHHGSEGRPAYAGADKTEGFPALEAIAALKPQLWIGAGDNVYYDHPVKPRAETQAELRRKWHEQHVQPRFVKLFAQTATYWLKDDHDYRFNDADAVTPGEPSHELGIKTFLEQAPIAEAQDKSVLTYRTHRLGKDLQLWMLEGRDYRSPNRTPDGPEKTIWGVEQNAWLRRTLKESDATFKILLTPSPLVGPDDAKKIDNHVNPKGFRREAEALFKWLQENQVSPQRFFIVTGDRHWKYHSIHATGYEEFCTGALNTENARLGRKPGDPQSSDPDGLIKQPFTDAAPGGGFLCLDLKVTDGAPTLEIIHYDDRGIVQYRVERAAR